MSFSSDVSRWRKKAEKAATNVFRGTALDLFAHIVRRSPVDTGRFRGNWQAEINTPPRSQLNRNDKTGAAAIRSAREATGRASLGESLFLVNNLPYAAVLERGNSKQAPRGMVRVTIREFRRLVSQQARKNRR